MVLHFWRYISTRNGQRCWRILQQRRTEERRARRGIFPVLAEEKCSETQIKLDGVKSGHNGELSDEKHQTNQRAERQRFGGTSTSTHQPRRRGESCTSLASHGPKLDQGPAYPCPPTIAEMPALRSKRCHACARSVRRERGSIICRFYHSAAARHSPGIHHPAKNKPPRLRKRLALASACCFAWHPTGCKVETGSRNALCARPTALFAFFTDIRTGSPKVWRAVELRC